MYVGGRWPFYAGQPIALSALSFIIFSIRLGVNQYATATSAPHISLPPCMPEAGSSRLENNRKSTADGRSAFQVVDTTAYSHIWEETT